MANQDVPSPAPERLQLAVVAVWLAVVPPALAAAGVMINRVLETNNYVFGMFFSLMLVTVPVSLLLGVIAFCMTVNSQRRSGAGLAFLAMLVSGGILATAMWFLSQLGNFHGRVLRRRGRPVLARVRRVAGAVEIEELTGPLARLGRGDRAVLGEYWTHVAREEHTSVEAFNKIARALAVHGAPASLIAGAQVAARQEAGHAVRCFAVASACVGEALAAEDGEIGETATATLATLAVEALVDGCVGEGTGAAEAAMLAADASLPGTLHATFAVIAREEAEHAALSWEVLVWCLEVGGAEVRAAVVRALAGLDEAAAPRHGVAGNAAQRGLGMVTRAERDAAWRTAVAETRVRVAELLRCEARAA